MSGENQPPIDTRSELSTSGFSGLLASVINAGRDILSRRRQATAQAPSEDLLTKCRQLLHHRGEASGLALACEVMADYQALDLPNKIIFFELYSSEITAIIIGIFLHISTIILFESSENHNFN